MKILLGGIPLGCDNIGDEAIVAAVVGMLKEDIPGVELTVATADPGTAGLLGVEVVPPYGFVGCPPDGFGEVPGGLGRAHLMTALEGMGRADGRRWATLNALFDRALAGAAPGRGHIFVTPVRQDVHPELIEQLRRATGEMPLVLVAEEVSGK